MNFQITPMGRGVTHRAHEAFLNYKNLRLVKTCIYPHSTLIQKICGPSHIKLRDSEGEKNLYFVKTEPA